jgi:hypothetical protein
VDAPRLPAGRDADAGDGRAELIEELRDRARRSTSATTSTPPPTRFAGSWARSWIAERALRESRASVLAHERLPGSPPRAGAVLSDSIERRGYAFEDAEAGEAFRELLAGSTGPARWRTSGGGREGASAEPRRRTIDRSADPREIEALSGWRGISPRAIWSR